MTIRMNKLKSCCEIFFIYIDTGGGLAKLIDSKTAAENALHMALIKSKQYLIDINRACSMTAVGLGDRYLDERVILDKS